LKRFIRHHTSYDPEITTTLCWQCHSWLHGSARIFHHPFIKMYGKDQGPWHFCARVGIAYEEAAQKYFDSLRDTKYNGDNKKRRKK